DLESREGFKSRYFPRQSCFKAGRLPRRDEGAEGVRAPCDPLLSHPSEEPLHWSLSEMPSQEFASEGFDIAASGGDGVVYEIGGGFTAASEDDSQAKGNQPTRSTEQAEQSPIDESERLKALGNGDFKQGNYLDAIDHYTDAIEACPYGETHGPSGEEILQMRDASAQVQIPAGKGNEEDKADDGGETDEGEEDPLPTFVPPRHYYGD
ncbi:hypothetical protein THAOC_26065, partial [Thalassiosira oceanica]